MKWISVKDRLPEKSGSYLTCNMDDSEAAEAYYSKKFNCWEFQSMMLDEYDIDFWMPLPDPPQTEEK